MSADAPIKPQDDLVHKPGPGKLWRESYYWEVCDPESEFMLYATFGKRPQRGRSGFLIAVWNGETEMLLAGQEVDTFSEHTDEHRIAGLTLECIEPFHRWRLRYEGALVRCHRAGKRRFAEPRRSPPHEREQVPVAFDIEFDCVGAPRVYEAQDGFSASFDGHYEQLTYGSGKITLDGSTRAVHRLPGIRDHSWGTRDWYGITASRWVAASFAGGPHVSLMRQTHVTGAEVLDGAVFEQQSSRRVTAYHERIRYSVGCSPPEAASISFTVTTEDGDKLEARGEVRALLPITFAKPGEGGLVNWNDRTFVAFHSKGRRGFGSVEFNSLLAASTAP